MFGCLSYAHVAGDWPHLDVIFPSRVLKTTMTILIKQISVGSRDLLWDFLFMQCNLNLILAPDL